MLETMVTIILMPIAACAVILTVCLAIGAVKAIFKKKP
jgi:hypothetical protein